MRDYPDKCLSWRTALDDLKQGRGAVVPRSFIENVAPRDGFTVLDYGCGATAPHVCALDEFGYDVVGYDLEPRSEARREAYLVNVGNGWIDPTALRRKYDAVLLSNVANVQASKRALAVLLDRAARTCRADGFLVANFPNDPCYVSISDEDFDSMLYRRWRDVGAERVGRTSVWWASCPRRQ